MNFLSDNLVYRRGQDYLRRRREKQTSRSRSRSAEREEGNGSSSISGDRAGPSSHTEEALMSTSTASSAMPPRSRRWSTLSTRLDNDPSPNEGDSADDEGESSAREHLDPDEVEHGGGDGWRHTDRVINARLSRGEQLQREKGVVEDALRSSLSTLMLLKAGTSSSKSDRTASQQAVHLDAVNRETRSSLEHSFASPDNAPPLSLSTSPSSTLTVRGSRHQTATPGRFSPPRSDLPKQRRKSGTSATTRTITSSLMERQHTLTRASNSSAVSPVQALPTSLQMAESPRYISRNTHARLSDADWTDASANISSTSSFEDLGGARVSSSSRPALESQEGSDLDMDFLESGTSSGTGSPRHRTSVLQRPGHTYSHRRISPNRHPRRSRRSRVNSLRRSAFASTGTQDGSLSDPGTRRTSGSAADDSFLELLEAAKTFMAMNPRYGSSSSTTQTQRSSVARYSGVSDAISWTAEVVMPEGTPRGRTIMLEQTMKEVSRPGSRGPSPIPPASMSTSATFDLSSSDSPPSHGLTSSRGGDEDTCRTGEEYNAITPPQPVSLDPRLSTEAKREQFSAEESDERPHMPSKPESWRDWIGRHLRRFTVGISVIGMGLVIAVGVGLLKPPLIRKGASKSSIPTLRVSF